MLYSSSYHQISSRHHPEFNCSRSEKDLLLSRKTRDDVIGYPIDGSSMTNLDIAEMCADWAARSEELGNSPIDWAEENIGKRWVFSEDQENLIYDILWKIWRE